MWADGANRVDKMDEDWDSLRAEVENPNLRDFEKLLEKEVHVTTLLLMSLNRPSHSHTFTFHSLRNALPLLTVDVKPF